MNDNKINPYTDNYMISFNQAKQLVIENSPLLSSETIFLSSASNRVLSSALISPTSVPSFDNSAMDGYAVNSIDLVSATKENPVCLELAGITAAGDTSDYHQVTKGKAWKIMTGAPVPDGFNSIIPVENTQLNADKVNCFSSPEQGAHVRLKGQDFNSGDPILNQGRIVNSNGIMACAALGVDQIQVYKKPSVAIFSTGKELVDDPQTPLQPGQIRNSNKPFIQNWLSNLPVELIDAGTNHDQIQAFENDLQAQLDSGTHIIISTGAVSMGDFDFIPQTIIKLGGEIIFHKAKIRPGKPILFAKFPSGTLYFGLPGNPISAAIGLRFFVSSAIMNMLGLPAEMPSTSIAKTDVNKKQGFRAILKANAQINDQAQHESTILEGQQSFKIHSLLNANGWAVISEDKDVLKKGDSLDFYPTLLNWE